MKTLKLATSFLDRENTFKVDGLPHATCSLHRDYNKVNDGIYWVMQHPAMICATYSAEEIAERNRLNNSDSLKNGETVLIDGKEYIFNFLGDHSDCGYFKAA